jgi:hypothetical protein
LTCPQKPRDILIICSLLIIFGVAEIYAAFSHNFFGISTSKESIAEYSSALIGSFYVVAGLSLIPATRRGAILAVSFLILDVIGRLVLVVSGYYLMNSLENSAGMAVGTLIAVIFAIYVVIVMRRLV